MFILFLVNYTYIVSMSARRYRQKIRSSYLNGPVSFPSSSKIPTLTNPSTYNPSTYNATGYNQSVYNPSTYSLYTNPTPPNPYSEIEELIFKIIESVTMRGKIEDIIEMATELFDAVKGKEEIIALVEQIEDTICSILQNVSDGVYLGIVLKRIECLKVLVDRLEPTCCVKHDGPIGQEILAILEEFGDKMDLLSIIGKMEILNTKLDNNIKGEKYIREAEEILVGVLTNICEGIDLGIVLKRVYYIQELVSLIDRTCIYYNANLGDKLIGLICMFSEGKFDLDAIQKEIIIVNDLIQKRMRCIILIEEAHALVNSIIQNVTDQVDLGIIMKRVTYLQELMNNAKKTYF
jgi:hypothetical protein